jgi:hypothetical protein
MINKILELNEKLIDFLLGGFRICFWLIPTILGVRIYFSDPTIPSSVYFLLGVFQIIFISAGLKFYKDFLGG